MTSYTKLDDVLSEEQLISIITEAVPPYAYRAGPRSWTWTRITGLWHLNLTMDPGSEHGGPSMKARLDGSPSLLQVCVRTTRREVDAALRFLVMIGAIDRHPDDPTAIAKPAP